MCNPETQIIPELLRVRDVCALVGLARSTIYALLSEDAFPAPVRVTRAAIRWHHADIADWIQSRPVATRPPRPDNRKAAI